MRPRLVFLIRDLGFGGAQRQLVTLARGLASRADFDVHVVSFYDGPLKNDLDAADISTHCIGKRHRWDLAGFFLRLLRTLREIRPAILHGYLAEANLMATLARPFCGNPVIVWGIRDSQSDAHQWGLLGKLSFRLNTLLSSTARGLIANSNAGRQWYRDHDYPMDDEDFRVIPNGIDLDRFAPRHPPHPFRQEHALTDSQPLIGIIGRLNPMKDHPTFLQAAARVTADLPDVRFLIMGSGTDDYLADLKQLAARLHLTDQIIWATPRNDLESIYPALDLLVSSSSFGEGFSNVLAEAMACGTPCVATTVGDSASIIGDTGWTCPPGAPDALAAAILHVIRLPATQRTTLRQSARTRIEENFTIHLMVRRTSDALTAWLPRK